MRQRNAFTLIELLVVVTIIVLMLAILMPSISRAMSAAQRAVCASQLRQIGLAVFDYATDYRGYVIPPLPDINVQPFVGVQVFNGVTTITTKEYAWWWYPEWLGLRITNRKTYICPSDTGFVVPGQPIAPVSAASTSDANCYILNMVTSSQWKDTLADKRITSVKRPALNLLDAEWGVYPGFSWHDPPATIPSTGQYDKALNNMIFVDGHLSYSKVYWSGGVGGGAWCQNYNPPVNGGYDYIWGEP